MAKPRIVFTVTVPLEGADPDFSFKWLLPAGDVEKGLLVSKAGAVIAGLTSGNLDASVFHSLREKGDGFADVLAGRLAFYQEVMKAMKRSADPVVCPTRAFSQRDDTDD